MKFADLMRRAQKDNARTDRERALADKLAGLDYLTQQQAARYCCISLRKFRDIAPKVGLLPFKFGGRLVYKRTDLQKAMEAARGKYL